MYVHVFDHFFTSSVWCPHVLLTSNHSFQSTDSYNPEQPQFDRQPVWMRLGNTRPPGPPMGYSPAVMRPRELLPVPPGQARMPPPAPPPQLLVQGEGSIVKMYIVLNAMKWREIILLQKRWKSADLFVRNWALKGWSEFVIIKALALILHSYIIFYYPYL